MSEIEFPTNPILPSDLSGVFAAPGSGPLAGASAEKTARDFESVFLYKVLEEMRRTIPESGLLETGISKQVQGIFWYYLAQDLAEKGGIGLGKELYRQMSGLTEQQGARPSTLEQPL